MSWQDYPKRIQHEVGPKGPLTENERERLATITVALRSLSDAWFATGPMLEELRRDRLYRETHDTFESFCKDTFGFGASQARKLISNSRMIRALSAPQKPQEDAENFKKSVTTSNALAASAPEQNSGLTDISTGEKVENVTAIKSEAQLAILRKAPPEKRKKILADLAATGVEITTKALTVAVEKAIVESAKPVAPTAAKAIEVGLDLAALATEIRTALKRIDDYAKSPYGKYFPPGQPTDSMRRLLDDIVHTRPFAVCPTCDGDGCGSCSNLGWLTKSSLKDLSKEKANAHA